MWRPRFAAFIWAALLVPVHAAAADKSADLAGQGDPAVSPDGTNTVDDPCEGLETHKPSEDVAYQAGVDVDGNPVMPADLDDGPRSLLGPNHEFGIPLTLPLSDATDTGPGTGAERVADSDVNIGQVTVQDGKVYFGGQMIGDQAAHALAEACAKRQAKAAK